MATLSPATLTALGAALDLNLGSLALTTTASVTTTGGIVTGNTSAVGGAIYSGSGTASAGLGNNGDFYLRTDTPGTLAQRIYIKSGGSWVNALA